LPQAVSAQDKTFVKVTSTQDTMKKILSDVDVCGTKELRVALSDGFGGNAWRKIARYYFEQEAKRCPNIKEIGYTEAQGNPEKQIADIGSLSAQGYNVIVINPDFGNALLRAMQKAMKAGATVIPYETGDDFGGEIGVDYSSYVSTSHFSGAQLLGEWIVHALNGKGNVIIYGGAPGSVAVGLETKGLKQVFDKHPGIKILEGPVTTFWDPQVYNKVTTGLLAKYEKIDAIYSDYGGGLMGALRAFKSAGRPFPIVAAADNNELACLFKENQGKPTAFTLGTIRYGGGVNAAIALRKGLAMLNHVTDAKPILIVDNGMYEDSLDPAKPPKCERDLPPEVQTSSVDNLQPQVVRDILAR
jgi:ribose transport system substrate-binding protein